MSDLSGTAIDRYHLIEKLGEGGMAVVYKAFDTRLECEVAVKIIRTENLPQSGVERALKRFEREAKSVARLTHANIIKVTDYGEQEGRPYLVMEYLPGGTLKQFIRKHGALPWQEAASLLIPIAEALSYAHSHNVIHRDVKPSNILLTENGTPMLTDFGVAKIIEYEGTQDLTGTSATVGTPEYMAPEQIVSKSVDHRADLYALGVVFYELVTGRRPYEADTPMAVLFKHASEPLPRPSQFGMDLPERVEYLLIKILAKKPEDRYQFADEVVKVLKELTLRVEVTAPVSQEKVRKPDKSVTEVTVRKGAGKHSHLRWLLVGLCVVALIGAGFGLSKLQGGSTTAALPPEISTEKPTLMQTEIFTQTPMLMPMNLPVIALTDTIEPTDMIFQTSEPYNTPNPSLVKAVVNQNVNCRYGPNMDYSNLMMFSKDSTVEIMGTNEEKDWVAIRMEPIDFRNAKNITSCWVNINYIYVQDLSTISIMDYPPLIDDLWDLVVIDGYCSGEYPNQLLNTRITNIIGKNNAFTKGQSLCPAFTACSFEIFGPYSRDLLDEFFNEVTCY